MDLIQILLIHAVIILAFVILGIIAKVTAAIQTRRSIQYKNLPKSLRNIGLALMLCLLIGGCGKTSDRLAVNGKVSLDGLPIQSGSIILKPQEKGPKVATKIVDGRYQFTKEDGPIPGKYRVEIFEDEKDPFPMDDPQAFADQAAADPSKLQPKNRVPEEFNKRTNLVAEPSQENQQIDFALNSSAR